MSLLSEVVKTVVSGQKNINSSTATVDSLVVPSLNVNNVDADNATIVGTLTLVDPTDTTKQGTLIQLGNSTVFSDIPSCPVPPTSAFNLCNKQYADSVTGGGCILPQVLFTSTNADYFPTFVATPTTSQQALNVDSGMKYNPATDTLTVGNLVGTVSSANQVNITSTSTNTDFFPVFVPAASSTSQQLNVNSGLKYNPGTDTLTVANLASNVSSSTLVNTTTTSTNTEFYPTFVPVSTTGIQNLNVASPGVTYNPGNSTLTVSNVVGTATSATLVNTTPTSSNTLFYSTFVNSVGAGVKAVGVASGLNYNPFTGTLTVTNVNGSIGSANQLNVTATSTNADFYCTFVSTPTSGTQTMNVNPGLKYNPGTNTLTVGNVVGNISSAVEVIGGTTPINPDVSTTLLAGTTHSLAAGSLIGQTKTIVKTSENVISTLLDSTTQMTGNGFIYSMKYDSVYNRIYVGGEFLSIGGVANTANIAYYDFTNSTWNALGFGTNAPVLDIVVTPNGNTVYFCGNFTLIGNSALTITAQKIGSFDKTSGTVSAMEPGATGGNGATLTLIGNYLYFGGSFTSCGGVANTLAVARWNTTTTTWSAVAGGAASGSVKGFTLDGDNLWIGGNFTAFKDNTGTNVTNTNYLARYNIVSESVFGYGSLQLVSSTQGVRSLLTLSTGVILMVGDFAAIAVPPANLNPQTLQYSSTLTYDVGVGTYTFAQYGYLNVSVDKLFKDTDGTVWAFPGNVLGNSGLVGGQGTVIFGSYSPYFYDTSAGKWGALLGYGNTQSLIMEKTNQPGVYWLFSSVIIDNETLTGTAKLVKFDKNNLVKVSSSLFVNGQSDRDRFHLVWKGQSVQLINLDNSNWCVTSTSLGNAVSARAAGQVFFY